MICSKDLTIFDFPNSADIIYDGKLTQYVCTSCLPLYKVQRHLTKDEGVIIEPRALLNETN